MAFSWQEETYASGTTDISVDIEYLDQSYIYVYLDDVQTTDFTWSSDVLITLDTALTASTVVTLVRRTDKEDLYIVFADGAAFIRENLDTQNTQFLHLAQELVEGRSIDGFYGDLSMNEYRITNLGTPTADTDATNKEYVDDLVAAEAAYRTAADASLQSQITSLAPVLSAERSIVSWHGQTIENSVTIPDGVNAFTIGPQITISSGQEVTIGEGSYWNVLGNVFESDELYNVTANNLITEDTLTTVAVDEIVVDSDIGTIAAQDSDSVSITGGSITGITDLAIADGGTGASSAATARTNLGLGSISTQDSDSVSITGGSITDITDLALADGGTGASTASDARTNLGAAASGDNTDITSLQGTTAGADADAGQIGEVLSATGTLTSYTTATSVDLVSLSLTAGDWEVDGVGLFDVTSGATSVTICGINTTSATVPAFPDRTAKGGTDSYDSNMRCRKRINVSTTTTVYLVGYAEISSGTVEVNGYLEARRVR